MPGRARSRELLTERLIYHYSRLEMSTMYPLFLVCRERALEVWSSSVADAKERALELASARDSSEQKAAEDHLAHDHAAQHMHRVELFRQRKLDLLQQDEVDDDELDISRGGNYAEVDFVRDTCGKLLTKLLLLRRRIVEAMQTELLRRDQLTTFETQYSKIASELHEAERLQRTYARGGITADVLGERSLQESADIDQAVAKQQVQLGTYQSVMKERLEMWNMTVSQVQKLKIAIRYKEGELQTTLHSIGENTASQRKKLGHLHAKNENMVTRKASLVSKTEEMRIRVKVLENEMTLLQMHSGQLFDTDIWHVGVVQRISTVKLKQDVQVRSFVTIPVDAKRRHLRHIIIRHTLAPRVFCIFFAKTFMLC